MKNEINNITLKAGPDLYLLFLIIGFVFMVGYYLLTVIFQINIWVVVMITISVALIFAFYNFYTVKVSLDSIEFKYWLKIYNRNKKYENIQIHNIGLIVGGRMPLTIGFKFYYKGSFKKLNVNLSGISNDELYDYLKFQKNRGVQIFIPPTAHKIFKKL